MHTAYDTLGSHALRKGPPARNVARGPAAAASARGWLAVAFVLAAACLHGAELHIGNDGEPLTLDPHRYNLRLEQTILGDLFEGLTTVDGEGRIVPGAAERWETSEDGLTWTFHLRKDGRWSDSTSVTAHDFVFSLRRLLNPATAASLAYFLYPVVNAEAINMGEMPAETLGVGAIDDYTLEIRLQQPFPFLAERLFYPTGSPVPEHVVAAHGDDWVKAGNMVTNGAFVLDEWVPQGHVRLRKSPAWRDAASTQLEAVTYHPTSDRSAAYNRFLSGEIDIIGDFPPGEIKRLQAERGDETHLSPLLSIMYLVFNTTATPFDDGRVRRALALAINRELITGRVLRSGEVPSHSFVPPLVAGFESHVAPRTPDPATARALLAAAGYDEDNPLEITLRHIAGDDNKTVQVVIAAMWKAIGVSTRLHHADLASHFAALRQGDFEVAEAGWFGENNPEHYLELLMSATGDVNYGRFEDAEYDSLMRRAKATVSLSERIALMQQAEVRGLSLDPVVPLYSVTIRSLVRKGVQRLASEPAQRPSRALPRRGLICGFVAAPRRAGWQEMRLRGDALAPRAKCDRLDLWGQTHERLDGSNHRGARGSLPRARLRDRCAVPYGR